MLSGTRLPAIEMAMAVRLSGWPGEEHLVCGFIFFNKHGQVGE